MSKNLDEEQRPRIDYGIIFSVMLLSLIGLSSLYVAIAHSGSAASPVRAVIMQGLWYVVGGIAVVVVMQFDSEQLWKIAPVAYGLGIFLLIAVLFLYDRNTAASTGAKSWFKIGSSITFQPSEVMKAAYILMLAKVVTQHNSEYLKHTLRNDLILFGHMLAWTLPVFVLLLAQHDLGTMLVFIAIFGGMMLMSGISWRILVPIFLAAVLFGGILIYLVISNEGRQILTHFGFKNYQFERIDSWLDPSSSTQDASMQLWQSMKAIGSGQIFGKGFNGTEVYVPVRESDMIFSVIGESFGFVGGCVLILIYFLLIYQMIRVCFDTKNEFYAYISTGVIMMILFHVFENIGMSIGLLPLTGIPLPFVSQGGTALLGNMLGIGLVMSMRYHNKSYMFSNQEENF